MISRPKIIFVTAIPGVPVEQLIDRVSQMFENEYIQCASISTSKLIKYGYEQSGLQPPNFSKILNWDEATEHFAMHTAATMFDEYIETHHANADVVFVLGHATFFHSYKQYFLREAIFPHALAQMRPDMIINVQVNPVIVQSRLAETQWSYLDVDQLARWTCDEYRASMKLSVELQARFEHTLPHRVVGAFETERIVYNLIMHPKHPIGYYSYPITGSTEEKELRVYLQKIMALKANLAERFVLVGHDGIGLNKKTLMEWKGASEFLQTFQLDMLIRQAQVQISVYLRPTKGSVPEISAGVQVEQSTADMLGLKTYLLHSRDYISPYQKKHADSFFTSLSDLQKALTKDGYTKQLKSPTIKQFLHVTDASSEY